MLRYLLITVFIAVLPLPVTAADPFDIAFNGSCDGLRLEIGTDLMVGGVHTGCVSGVVAGNVAIDFGAFPFAEQGGFGVNIRPVRIPGLQPVVHTLLDFKTMRFGVYLTLNGEPPVLFRSGTFRFGAPSSAAALPPAGPFGLYTPDGERSTAAPAIGPFDISFDGHCDGLQLSIGADAMTGGSHTGCESGLTIGNTIIGIVANPFDQASGAGLTLGTFPEGPNAVVTLINFAERRWAHYRTQAGEVPALCNSGTFSLSPPGPEQASLPSSRLGCDQ